MPACRYQRSNCPRSRPPASAAGGPSPAEATRVVIEVLANKTGYETAWNLMHLSGAAPCFKVTPDAPNSTSVTPMEGAGLSVSFANPPSDDVIVSISTNNDGAVMYEPAELVFTPENYDVPQRITMLGLESEQPMELYTITASTASADPAFDGLTDSWEYTVTR